MNFNIYLDDETGQQLNQVARQAGETRNALVRQAVSEWLKRHSQPQWPDEVASSHPPATRWHEVPIGYLHRL